MYVVVANGYRNIMFYMTLYYLSLYSQWLHYGMDISKYHSNKTWSIYYIVIAAILRKIGAILLQMAF